MSFSAPTPPDPTQTANKQQGYNTDAAKLQNQNNSYDQSTPFGSVNYVPDPNSPSGYRIQTNTSATGNTLLGAAGNLASNSAGMYSQPYDINAASKATAANLNDWQRSYLEPIFNQQDSNLEAKLHNQGLMPGTEAYNNAKNLLTRNQFDSTNAYLTNNQKQAFDQALTSYQTPLATIGGLMQTANPGNFQSTPNASIQPANYQGAAQNAYQGQLQNYENTWNNVGKLGVAGIGLAAAPFTGGASLAGSLGGMFGSAPGGNAAGSPMSWAGGWG